MRPAIETADLCVVGGGVVGLAVAARLARPDRSVVLVETHPRHGMETSSRNSEVIHAGLYYPRGSLKSALCHEGRRRLYELCPKAGIRHRKTGKLVVAVDDEEAAALARLKASAEAAGAEGLSLLSGAQARARAPGLKAAAALWSAESGIIDSEGLMSYLLARAKERGAVFAFGSRVTAVERDGGYVLTLSTGERLRARAVVNSAGLHADQVAALAGVDVDAAGYRLHWCKGVYFRCARKLPIDCLIYPMPGKHGLGVHITLDLAGRCRFGPDTRFVDRLDYAVEPERAAAFTAAVSRYWPSIVEEQLTPDTAGIRPKLSGPEGGFRDFVVAEESARGLPGWVNLVGIESPGLTASLALADRVAALLGAP